jgi:hypothetical protein
MLVILTFTRLRKESREFQANQGYIARPYFKEPVSKKKTNNTILNK